MEINKPHEYEPLDQSSKRKGGFRACIFVYALTTLDAIGSVTNLSVFSLYFKYVMNFADSETANTFTNFSGTTYLLTVVGGFVSDSYLSRFSTCLSFGTVQIMALIMITVQAYLDKLHPAPCGKPVCLSGGKALMFYGSLYMLALGAGGVRGSLQPLGADQFDRNTEKGAKSLGTYFNGFVLSTTLGAIVGVTIVIWVAFNKGWYWGFFIGTITSSIGFIVLASGKSFYVFQPRGESPFTRVAQVIVLAIGNRHLSLPESSDQLYEVDNKGRGPSEEKVSHTNQFRSLDKAAILQDGMKPEPWKVCTVTQVEEVKILARMLPILASTVIMNTCLAQLQTYSVLQGMFMDPYLGSFKIPTASIPVIPLLFMVVLIPMYEFLVIPLLRKMTGHPSGVTQLQRAGVGLVLSAISMTIAGLVEVKRKNQFFNDPLKPISLFWLSFQYGFIGVADMFTMAGLSEFFYKEAPSGMRSLSTSFNPLSLSFGAFLSTIFVNIINAITKRITPSKQGWLVGIDLNHSNLNFFYWFLAILSCINFVNYLYWTSWYKYREENDDAKALIESSVQEEQSK